MIFTNSKIYELGIKSQVFYKDKLSQLPVKAGFYLFKNLKTIRDAAIEIEDMRQSILEPFKGQQIDDTTFKVDEKLREQAQKRLTQLSNLEQDLPIYPISLEDFEEVKFTSEQLEVLIELIEDINGEEGEI